MCGRERIAGIHIILFPRQRGTWPQHEVLCGIASPAFAVEAEFTYTLGQSVPAALLGGPCPKAA